MKTVFPVDFAVEKTDDSFNILLYCLNETGEKILLRDTTFVNFCYVLGDIKKMQSTVEKMASCTVVEKKVFGKNQQVLKLSLQEAHIGKEFVKQLLVIEGVQTVLEADIQVVRKYLVTKHIVPLRAHAVKVDGDVLQSITVATDYLSFNRLQTLAFDIETYGKSKRIDTKNNPILTIGLYSQKRQEVLTWAKAKSSLTYVTQVADEKTVLETFFARILEDSPELIVGYNSDGFDWAYVQDRCQILGVKVPIGLSFSGGTQRYAYVKGIPHIDIFHFIRINMRTSLKTNSYSLNAVADELIGDTKKPVDIAQLYKAWDAQDGAQLDIFAEYNLHDCKLTFQLVEKLFANILEFLKLIHMPIQDITRMSYSQLVESYLYNRAQEMNELAPNKPHGEELNKRLSTPPNVGAFVYTPKPGFYENVAVFDFQSLYPSIIASLNLDGSTIITEKKEQKASLKVPENKEPLYFSQTKQGLIPTVIKDIISRRVEVKTELKEEKDEYKKQLLAARIYNLKILANSMYGYLAFAHARWHSNESAAATTAYARHYIKHTIERAQKTGFQVLYGDTDSIFIELREKTLEDAKQFVVDLNKTLPGIMELQFEDFFMSGIFVQQKGGGGGAKKRYALYSSEKDSFKITGFEYVRTDWCQFARESQYELITLLLKEKNPTKGLQFVRDQIKKLQDGVVAKDQLILSSKLSREVEQYTTNLPHVIIAKELKKRGDPIHRGSRIQYLVLKGKGHVYERVGIPDEIALEQIDVEYYIHNQLIPVVSSLMEVFGYKEEDFLGNTKQDSLNQFFA